MRQRPTKRSKLKSSVGEEASTSDISSLTGSQRSTIFQAGTMFPNAYNCTFNSPLLVDMQSPPGSEALKWLQANSMTGVEYNSSARAPPPKCCFGTRSSILSEIHDLLRHPGPKPKLLWMKGPVGVGKTTLVQTLTEREARDARLGATLFFPPSPAVEHSQTLLPVRSDDSRMWTTISYRLATKNASYLNYVKQQIDRDPKLVEQSMEQQFETLITKPIGRKGLIQTPHSLSVWLDGLEQCCWKNPRSQERILQLIITFVQEYPSSPIVWIIASRPEKHLIRIFEKHLHLQDHIKEISISIDSDDSRGDVQSFLGQSFDMIREEFDIIQPYPWPEQNDFDVLLLAISGLFLFASAVVYFVGDHEVGDPKAQFDSTLSVTTSEPTNPVLQEGPLTPVHKVYTEVLRSMHLNHYPTAKRLLGFLLLPKGFGNWTHDSTSFWELCNILGIKDSVAYSCLSKLYSLMEVPKRKDATTMPVRFYHSSFAQYLANREYSQNFYIDMKEVIADLWQCHFQVLQMVYVKGQPIPDLSTMILAWPSTFSDNQAFRENLWENARRMFFHHLLPCSSTLCPLGLHYDALSDTEKPSVLVDVLQKINFHNLVDGYVFPDVPYRFLKFLDWVVGEVGQACLQRDGLLKKFSAIDGEFTWIDQDVISFQVTNLSLDDGGHVIGFRAYSDRVFISSMDGLDPGRLFSTRETPKSHARLLSDLELNRNNISTAVVLGSNTGERCVILAITSLRDRTLYYVLPLRPRWSLVTD